MPLSMLHDQLLIANGVDITGSVRSYYFQYDKCHIKFINTDKVYSYNASNVQILNLQQRIDPKNTIVFASGRKITDIDEILDFGPFYRIVLKNKDILRFNQSEVKIIYNCLADEEIESLFDYFKETAKRVSLVTDDGDNILYKQYEKISFVSNDTALASYLNTANYPQQYSVQSLLIYPFGINQSQKQAVENAFSSQVSIIQGPPGTGKTQTILNIIANVVFNNKTVAVVSNNNSATMNVVEKLKKKGLSFITAFLGSSENKNSFLTGQSGKYPNMVGWKLDSESERKLSEEIKFLSKELDKMLIKKNRIAEIEQTLLELKPEQHFFNQYFATFSQVPSGLIRGLSSQKILSFWLEYEQSVGQSSKLGKLKRALSLLRRYDQFSEQHNNLGLLKKISLKLSTLKTFICYPEVVIPLLQKQFYIVKKSELQSEIEQLETDLDNYSFEAKLEELSQKSLQLFRSQLAKRFSKQKERAKFDWGDFYQNADNFNEEYPVILSTTYSIKGTLSVNHIYDYLIIDEASQVDLATGVLAFSCAKNVVIVGDLKQLPNVITKENIEVAESLWETHSFDEIYHFTTQSLLSSAVSRWHDAPSVLLKEHYRCHPKIIGFCNQKFYQNQLVVMTKDHGEQNVLTMYRTTEGNHARGHFNQRQIDVIKNEVLPFLEHNGFRDIGIISPYREQVEALSAQLGNKYEVATVHKFQGREKDAIILTSVDNIIGGFTDDPNLLNVAISRAVRALVVVTSQNEQNDKTNYGDLSRYIEYNNFEIINSSVFSLFDFLYTGYAQQRQEYLRTHKHVSDYDSENLLYSVIENILQQEPFQLIGCAVHVSLVTLIKDYDLLSEDEKTYARNPLTHVDFLLFNKMDKSPVMAIELDGTNFHKEGSQQSTRDVKKDSIFEKCGIKLLRIRTDESGEYNRITQTLQESIQKHVLKV